jgi:hypothetical protein
MEKGAKGMVRTLTSVVLSPEQLQEYGKIDPSLPGLVLRGRDHELQREFLYAIGSLTAGVIAFLSIVGGYVYLVMHEHPNAAAALLGTGVLSLIGGFIRARLRTADRGQDHS